MCSDLHGRIKEQIFFSDLCDFELYLVTRLWHDMGGAMNYKNTIRTTQREDEPSLERVCKTKSEYLLGNLLGGHADIHVI